MTSVLQVCCTSRGVWQRHTFWLTEAICCRHAGGRGPSVLRFSPPALLSAHFLFRHVSSPPLSEWEHASHHACARLRKCFEKRHVTYGKPGTRTYRRTGHCHGLQIQYFELEGIRVPGPVTGPSQSGLVCPYPCVVAPCFYISLNHWHDWRAAHFLASRSASLWGSWVIMKVWTAGELIFKLFPYVERGFPRDNWFL